jgi:HSP20 family protein
MSQNPLRDLLVLQERMNRLFEDATERRARGAEIQDALESADWVPAADVSEHNGQYLVTMDLPGVDRDSLEITFDNDRLSIKGERPAPERSAADRIERPSGLFSRTFSVSTSIEQQQITADYHDGVLQVRLPRRREPEGQRMKIKIS